jgi:hypothetical protein
MFDRMRRTPALALAAAALALVVSGCGADEAIEDAVTDAASDAATDAACSVAGDAVDQASRVAEGAGDAIGVNPQEAKDDLQVASDALGLAQVATTGDLNADLVVAKTAIDLLLSEATAAVAGDVVDTNVVNAAQEQLDGAVEDVKGIC